MFTGSYGEIWRWLSLRRVPVLSTVSDAEITELVSHLDELSLRPGELVYDVGDVGDCMYVAERGEFLITDADGKRVGERLEQRDVLQTTQPRLRRHRGETFAEKVLEVAAVEPK